MRNWALIMSAFTWSEQREGRGALLLSPVTFFHFVVVLKPNTELNLPRNGGREGCPHLELGCK